MRILDIFHKKWPQMSWFFSAHDINNINDIHVEQFYHKPDGLLDTIVIVSDY